KLFQWKYRDIARECEEVLAPQGYGYVQVAPVQEYSVGEQWWRSYQPVSHKIGSRQGSEEDFDEMVLRCKAAGVGVIVDAVINHMGTGTKGVNLNGSLGSVYQKYEYPNLYSSKNFHHCNNGHRDLLRNFSDRYELQQCELYNLADLDTSQPEVQSRITDFLQLLVSKGVSGLRIDAAKHIDTKELEKILSKVRARIIQEVTVECDDGVKPMEYVPGGRVYSFQAARDITNFFMNDGISYLAKPVPFGEDWGEDYMPSSHSQVFVTNWDLERGKERYLRWDMEPKIYLLAQTFLLVWGYGQVDVFSSYNFKTKDDNAPKGEFECGRNSWRCEHRHPMILGAIQLRSASAGQPVLNILTEGTQRLAFNRGTTAFIAINNYDSEWNLEGNPVGLPLPTTGKQYYKLSLYIYMNIKFHAFKITRFLIFDFSVS
ncbi:glycoside hydrolase superfamily, partial [Phakopsora pachyrhizi]